MADYILPHSIPQEDERLTLMSRMLDPQLFFRLEQVGVAAGWRCLEVGAGNGSVSHWLAERVGPRGHVVCSDIDTRFLSALEAPNLEVRRIDVTTDPLGEDYDLVLTRALLHHVPQRIDVLHRLAAAVRPGGILVVEEPDFHPVLATDSPALRDFWRASWRGRRVRGSTTSSGGASRRNSRRPASTPSQRTARRSSSRRIAPRALSRADDARAGRPAAGFRTRRKDHVDRGHAAPGQRGVLDLAELLRHHYGAQT